MTRRNSYLDRLRAGGTWPEFYDPEGERYGIPTFPFRYAPKGYLTRRQLRAAGLAPGGQGVQAQILWRHRNQRRVAYLYDAELAAPKREATPAQLAAVTKALAARRTCQSCGIEKDYCIPTSLGECPDCAEGTRRQPAADLDREAG